MKEGAQRSLQAPAVSGRVSVLKHVLSLAR